MVFGFKMIRVFLLVLLSMFFIACSSGGENSTTRVELGNISKEEGIELPPQVPTVE